MDTEERDKKQSVIDALQYDVFQRELDRALDGYNAVYSRISMSLVVVGVLLGFMFMGPGEVGFRGAMKALQGNDLPIVWWTRWFYSMSLVWYLFALCRLLYSAGHRPVFRATYHSDPWFNLSEHELRKKETEQCSELAQYYRGAARDLLLSCRSSNVFIVAGVVFYVIAEFLLLGV